MTNETLYDIYVRLSPAAQALIRRAQAVIATYPPAAHDQLWHGVVYAAEQAEQASQVLAVLPEQQRIQAWHAITRQPLEDWLVLARGVVRMEQKRRREQVRGMIRTGRRGGR